MTQEQKQALARLRQALADSRSIFSTSQVLLGETDVESLLAIIDGFQNGYDPYENPPEDGQEVLLEWVVSGVRIIGTYDGEDFELGDAICPRRWFSRWWPLPKRKEQAA